MDFQKCPSWSDVPSTKMAPLNFVNKVHAVSRLEEQEGSDNHLAAANVDVDIREVYFLIMRFLSTGPCQKTFTQILDELLEHELLPRRYHAWYSRSGAQSGHENDDGVSFPLNYDNLVKRFPHIEDDHLVKLLRQLMLSTSTPLPCIVGRTVPSASDVPTLLGTGSFSLLCSDRNSVSKQVKHVASYLRWPHMLADQVRGLSLREIGGGFSKHHRAPSVRFASYAVAKPSMMVQKMQNIKKLRGHRDAVYCAIFDRSGRYVITGSDDRLVKIWSMETAFCLASCRGHEGDITDLAVSSNNILVASASNDYSIRVWRLPDGFPISVLQGHTGAVTAIAFSPRPSSVYQLLSSSDDGTCRIWDARSSDCSPRVYLPTPLEVVSGKTSSLPLANVPSSSNVSQCHQILCCAYNANGTVFVTGSSDTHARVWSACKSNSDDPEQPSHEIDLLAGHENDVNYVQFSCAVASRSSASDFSTEENIPKFKNSWFSHDNIVTCSRDGSAIIWTPKSRRSQGKVGRWIRAYHLKVPPPPMPPQPPRGGPRQRFLPTPRGVNMIVWSLDNRFVLAAIMDNRICVWNASDGSLVHSLTGHTASTYVLDVHPFNPRIAMSAGYDGKTIVWDIWEGIPIWTYEIGRFKLVDGKFSQDGTSIVLSDDVGQIYLLNTGQGEAQKDAKYDQFFLGDYRPLVQDTHGNTLDQETQVVLYNRNIQDPLCDSSMIPYPEPYQSAYQRRRLGALNIEWRPSSSKLAVGPDIGLGQEYQVLPLADLDLVVEPVPEFADMMYLEPENDVIHNETDSEYYITDEYTSEDEEEHSSDNSSSDPECSEENTVGRSQKDGLRRSIRKKSLSEVEPMSTSGRHVKKRILHGNDVPLSKSKRTKRSRSGRKYTSKRKSAEVKLTRSQRLAARNAINGFSHISEISTDGEEDESPEGDSSGNNSSFLSTNIKTQQPVDYLPNVKRYLAGDQGSLNESETAVTCPPTNVGNKKKLVLKLTLNNSKKSLPPEHIRSQSADHTVTASYPSKDSGSSYTGVTKLLEGKELENIEEDLTTIAGCEQTKVHLGEAKVQSTNWMRSPHPVPADLCYGSKLSSNCHSETCSIKHCIKPEDDCSNFRAGLEIVNHKPLSKAYNEKQEREASVSEDADGVKVIDQNLGKGGENISDTYPCRNCDLVDGKNHSGGLNEIKKPKPTILKIKSKKISGHSFPMEQNNLPSMPEDYKTALYEGTCASIYKGDEFPDIATDEMRRKRSLRLKATTRETGVLKQKSIEKPSGGALNHLPSRGMPMSKQTSNHGSARNKGEGYNNEVRSALHALQQKSNWLLLSEQEEGYRYIPQLGDEVMYLRQGHQEYMKSVNSLEQPPWTRYGGNIRSVEVCLVEELDYSTIAGSGESGCRITLKFIDPSSEVNEHKFKLNLPELIDFPDFVVERTWYEASMNRNWTCRDKCLVWWRDESEEGGSWWDGRIISIKDKSSEFPDSPWERYVIKYKSASEDLHLHCPWEMHDPSRQCEHPCIDPEVRNKMLASVNRLLQSASRNQDQYGILKLDEVSQKDDFINKFPVPLSPDVIKLRLENNYYRTLDSLKHDIRVMLTNGQSYFARSKELSAKMCRLSDWFHKKFLKI
ncbi:uncharacterized protein [Coffea arabica]|uniref:Uncharacterized protein isoform X1 n=2 Tax=Coffea arabica TaxID=13443 RepID=A0A6P6WUS8_COFAR